MIWSTPVNATADISRSRSGETSRTPSTSPNRAAYMRATALADILPPAGMSAINMSVRLPNSAVGVTARGPNLKNGDSSGIAARYSALPSASSSRASLPSSDSGTPRKSSSATPSGPANDLAENVAERVGVIRHPGARFPPGLGVGDRCAHLLPVAQILRRGVGRHARHPDRVRQDVPYGRGLLAVSAELRPQLYDRCVVAEVTPLDE